MATGVDPVVGLGQLLTVFVGATAASMVALYGTRSACDISRHHVHDVFARAPKYGPYLGEL